MLAIASRSNPLWTAVLLFALLVIAGCATTKRDAAFPEVRDLVSQRLQSNVVWNTSSELDRAATQAVRRLLSKPLTPEAAVQIALLNNRRLQATYEELGIAQADLVEAGLLENPVFSAIGLFGDAGVEWDLDVVQNFLSVLTLSARKKIGAAAAKRTTLRVSQTALDLAREVQAQYYAVVGDAQSLELAQQVVIATEAGAELAQRQFEAGNLSQKDQAIQQAFYAQTLLEVAQTQAQLAVDRERLNRLLGLWGEETRWSVPTRLPKVPDTLSDLQQIEALAVAQRFDLAAAKKDAEAVGQALALAEGFRYVGPLGMGVAFKRDTDGTKSVGPAVKLGIPIFNQGQPTIARLQSEYARRQKLVGALAVEIRSEAREAGQRLTVAHDAVRYYEKVLLPLQQKIVGETLKFYNGMLIGAYDLLLAQRDQVQTGRQYIAASKEFWIAWADLERATGGRVVPAAASMSGEAAPAQTPTPASGSTLDSDPHSRHAHGDK